MQWRRPSGVWWLVLVLSVTAVGFWRGFEHKKSALASPDASIETGDLVTVVAIADGDSVVVKTRGGESAPVRLLGIKALPPIGGRDEAEHYGKEAVETLRRVTHQQPVRVLLNSPPKDDRGRYLAVLFLGDQDIGLALVKAGLALVYTVYPFPGMGLYLQEQAGARAARVGMWGNDAATERAGLLIREWQAKKP